MSSRKEPGMIADKSLRSDRQSCNQFYVVQIGIMEALT